MSIGYRNNLGYAGEPIQQSMITSPGDNQNMQAFGFKLGIVLTVYTSDSPYNISSRANATSRGFRHECCVQILDDGTGNYSKIDNVIIPPSVSSGLNNYEEQLPRGCTSTTNATSVFDPNFQLMNPLDADGDFCVVGFIGGNVDLPFIVSWWPHPRNYFDVQTKGPGTLNANTQGFVLDQSNRYFRRINGIEVTATSGGDLYIDTSIAGTQPIFSAPPQKGRITRIPVATGGNIRTVIKPTATFELDWNIPQDGEGLGQLPEPQLIQSNPATTPTGNTFAPQQKTSSFMKADATVFDLMTPAEIKLKSSLLNFEGQSVANLLAPVVYIGGRNTDLQVEADTSTFTIADTHRVDADIINYAAQTGLLLSSQSVSDIQAQGSHTETSPTIAINGTTTVTVTTPSCSIDSPQINLGQGVGQGALLSQVSDDFELAIQAIVPPNITAPTPATNAASIASIIIALEALGISMTVNQSINTTMT